jgi:hypothetical protein
LTNLAKEKAEETPEIVRNIFENRIVKRNETNNLITKKIIPMKRNSILMSILAIVFTTTISAQPRGNGQCDRPQHPEMKKFVVENILPMITEQRQRFDNVMNTNDKTEINRLRSEIKEIRLARNEKWQMNRNPGQRMNTEQRQEMRKHRIQMDKLMDKATIIADKYADELMPLLDDLRDNVVSEKERYCPEHPAYDQERKSERRMRRNAPNGNRRGFGMHERKGFHFERILTPVGFLLFDPTAIPADMDKQNTEGNLFKVNLFPNPASQSVQVSLMLEERESVSIHLLDRDGNVLRKISEQTENAGMFTNTIQLDNLADGLYFVKAAAGEKTATERLIVKK